MRRHLRLHFLASVAMVLALATALNFAAHAGNDRSNPAIESHVPEPEEQISYTQSLADMTPVNETLDANNQYDWYCFKANADSLLIITVTRNSGDMTPNCGLLEGVVDDNVAMENLGQILAATNSSDPDMVTLMYTPTFTGPVTLWVSEYVSTTSNYTVEMVGGEERTECTPCPSCVLNPMAPPLGEASFKFGDPVFSDPDLVTVPLIVDTHNNITFTQMKIEYESSCLIFQSVAPGNDIANPVLPIFEDDVVPTVFDKARTIQLAGTYSGCDQEVYLVTFQFANGFTLPCKLSWDVTFGGPNSPNHLNHTDGAPGKILPGDINFCDGLIECDSDIVLSGDVLYYSNATPIVSGTPDGGSAAVTVASCTPPPTTTAMGAGATFDLPIGAGPIDFDICASRPAALCGTNEDGVLSGDDVLMIINHVADSNTYPFDDKQMIAGDVNGDNLGFLTNDDAIAVKRWIGRKVCDNTDTCTNGTGNCAATWRFIFFTDPGNPNDFTEDMATLNDLCTDSTIAVQGILLGDVDGSWPNFFNKPSEPVALEFVSKETSGDELTVSLNARLNPGESLRHVIYSLDYDPAVVEYLGMQAGSRAADWGSFDNPETPGVTHGIAHIPALADPVSEPGEILEFRFRVVNPELSSKLSFSRLKANDTNVEVPAIEIGRGGIASTTVPSHYSLKSQPNPFNPATRVRFTIPDGVGKVPVVLRVYDIAGRQVRTLLQGERGPGFHDVAWNGRDENGNTMSAGVYLMRIHAGEWSDVEKVTLVK